MIQFTKTFRGYKTYFFKFIMISYLAESRDGPGVACVRGQNLFCSIWMHPFFSFSLLPSQLFATAKSKTKTFDKL